MHTNNSCARSLNNEYSKFLFHFSHLNDALSSQSDVTSGGSSHAVKFLDPTSTYLQFLSKMDSRLAEQKIYNKMNKETLKIAYCASLK
jgi:hypothetical protein